MMQTNSLMTKPKTPVLGNSANSDDFKRKILKLYGDWEAGHINLEKRNQMIDAEVEKVIYR